MIKSTKNYIIIFLISFALTWLCTIFYFDKNEFDIEFRETKITTAKIFNFGTSEVVEEFDDGRNVNAYNVDYIEYSYLVDGKNYKYGSEHFQQGLSIGDKIEIEYVKNNPTSSKLKDLKRNKFNFFTRNLMMVSICSFLIMLGVFYIFDRFNNKDSGWRH